MSESQHRLCVCGLGRAQFTESAQGLFFCTICGGQVLLQEEPQSYPQPKSILLVDSDPELRQKIQETLMASGHATEAVDTGYHAIAAAGRLMREQAKFDLILVSLELNLVDGESISGIQTLRLLRLLLPSVPIIMLSGAEPTQGLMLALKQRGANRFISRNSTKLTSALLKHIAELDE